MFIILYKLMAQTYFFAAYCAEKNVAKAAASHGNNARQSIGFVFLLQMHFIHLYNFTAFVRFTTLHGPNLLKYIHHKLPINPR